MIFSYKELKNQGLDNYKINKKLENFIQLFDEFDEITKLWYNISRCIKAK